MAIAQSFHHGGADMTQQAMYIEGFFDSATSTVSYILLDNQSRACAIIDSVLDFDLKSGRIKTESADKLLARVEELGGWIQWHLETHVHADHLSAAVYLRERVGGQIAIGACVTQIQGVFGKVFNTGPKFATDGSQFDQLFSDGESFAVGSLSVEVLHTPGHTQACVTYVVGNSEAPAAFVGDTLFMPDYGTARCDFPGGDARLLYRSIKKVLGLPSQTILYLCHDYQPGGRPLKFTTTVEEQRVGNIHVRDGISEDTFVEMRMLRDATLSMPALMLPAVQINMCAGKLPEPEGNGIAYLKIPINSF